ncbi:hypothetical protein QUO16_004573 [Vibrio parahaemolyticus]|uniref:HNH endonuclease n=1 Tax=Vibrio parahaemolyticus TaxID=670 RepID=UPI000A3A9522|nr:HNH endonuclease [Vibrio parahaemolyticus]ELA9373249.1 hypothetical protein [Vibrio parahaemolyticus]OUJ48373.1 hypothetical protein BTM22_24140 [Vibrio parahaemolyticus]TOE56289.1 hypothetical protein CGJ40_23635 [Vibrio parahaemolyticus]HCG8707696.1 hypothetical protein [Vibrio parahaemolyticus]
MIDYSFKKYKDELFQEFEGKCCYCGVKAFSPQMVDIEHFKPKSLYPELANDKANLLIACRECNMFKAAKFPLDDNGEPLLLNPLEDDFSKHIKISENGYLEGLTERGKATISTLRLNREGLVEQRILNMIDMEYTTEHVMAGAEVYTTFKRNLEKVDALSKLKLPTEKELDTYMVYMLYANVITALETYLCDRFISVVQGDKKNLRSFVEEFHDFRDSKFSLSEIFHKMDTIEERAIDAMKGVLYHNLPKVSGIYSSTLGIKFPKFSDIYKSVKVRHDLVHRSGKDKDGKYHEIGSTDVTDLIGATAEFVDLIEVEIAQLK